MNDELHKIAKDIVDEAVKYNAIIAIGDLNGVRKNNKGRKINRKVHSMPFYRLKEYIRYKALERGILVIDVPEFNTSKQCSKCGSMNTKRPSQGVFICKDCGYQINADVNGAKNILKRAVGYMLTVGAVVTQPERKRLNGTLPNLPDSKGRRSPFSIIPTLFTNVTDPNLRIRLTNYLVGGGCCRKFLCGVCSMVAKQKRKSIIIRYLNFLR